MTRFWFSPPAVRKTRTLLACGAASLWLIGAPAFAQMVQPDTSGTEPAQGPQPFVGGGHYRAEQTPQFSKPKVQYEAAPKVKLEAPKITPLPQGVLVDQIYAVVNGEVITASDIDNRAKLFALSSGLPLAPDVVARLRGQIGRQLIDDKLRLQEIQRRKIVVADTDVANAIAEIETRNNLKKGELRGRLESQGVDFSAMIGQIRAQLGWTKVLRQHLADRTRITPDDIAREEAQLKTETGQPQYHVSEIFVAAEDPSKMGEARKFTETVIEQLHRGVAFGIAAAQFSQSETALTGGDLGWVSPDQLDPQVAALIHEMPIGAVSNPIPVAGGYSIVTVREKRLVGQDMANVLTLHQAFFPFTTALDPQAPTDQQKGALAAAGNLSKTAHDCGVLDAANKAQGEKRPTDPGPVREDRLNPHMRQIISALAIGQPSQPLVTPEGILVVMVCKREQKNMAVMTREDIANQLLQERVELSSRQLLQDLKRRALIDMHS